MAHTTKTAPPRRKALIGLVIVVVVLVVVLAGLWYVFDVLGRQVNITAVNVQFTGCWQDSTSGGASGLGFGTTYSEVASLTAPSYLTCNITGVSIATNGFSVQGSNTPLTIQPGATQTLSVTIGLPSSSYTGAITIVVQVTAT